jgi:hypothetical protein
MSSFLGDTGRLGDGDISEKNPLRLPLGKGIGIYTAYPVLSKGILAASVLR